MPQVLIVSNWTLERNSAFTGLSRPQLPGRNPIEQHGDVVKLEIVTMQVLLMNLQHLHHAVTSI